MTAARNEQSGDAGLDQILLSVWEQVLVSGAKKVMVASQSYPVRRTPKNRLAQVDFEFEGQTIRGLEQNLKTSSRWAQLARKGSKVMQFLIAGRYIAAVADGKITHYTNKRHDATSRSGLRNPGQ